MERLIERCAGLDVHKKTVAACVRTPGQDGQRQQQTRTFTTTTKGLVALRDWLTGLGVTVVGMESTGTYWKPVYYLLENAMTCWLLNARHLRNVPGRKTDVADAAWIAQLVEHGLVRPSFVPPRRSGSCATSPATARRSSPNAPARPSGWKSCWRTPAPELSCVASDILGSRAGRCWPPWSPASATPWSWPSWPRVACASRFPCSRRPWSAASGRTTPSL